VSVVREIELSQGTIEYADTGGAGPTIVLLHGLLMDSTLWEEVVAELAADHRCIAPTLPLGAHRRAMRADSDLSLEAVAGLVVEFLERLNLDDVTLVGNDTGGGLVQLIAGEPCSRVGRIALVSCDAFENFPPGLTGRALVLSAKLPPALFGAFMQQMRIRALRRLPIAFGWLTLRGDAACRRWLEPILTRPEIRRDTVRVLRGIAADPQLLERAADRLPAFERPALVVWASGDRVMPQEHGQRLAKLLPAGRYAEIADSCTLIPLDQPIQLAHQLRELATPAGPLPGRSDEPVCIDWAPEVDPATRAQGERPRIGVAQGERTRMGVPDEQSR
jgi:pimeloyl-ACP methyl ester carboxylesterase